MAWGADPMKEQAAQAAADEAQAAIARRLDAQANAALSPFERRLLGLIEDLRDAVKSPGAGPVLATIDPNLSRDTVAMIRSALPDGSLITGPNSPILSVVPLTGVPVVVNNATTTDGLAMLADAEPTDLGRAVDAAAKALIPHFADCALWRRNPDMEVALCAAEAALEAALTWHLGSTTASEGQDGAHQDGAAGGRAGQRQSETPPADHPTT